MSDHLHTEFTPGCYRCEIGRDEAFDAMTDQITELEAEVERLTRERDEARAAIVPPVSVTGSSQTGVGGLPADLVGALAAVEARERALREALTAIVDDYGEFACDPLDGVCKPACWDCGAIHAARAALGPPEEKA